MDGRADGCMGGWVKSEWVAGWLGGWVTGWTGGCSGGVWWGWVGFSGVGGCRRASGRVGVRVGGCLAGWLVWAAWEALDGVTRMGCDGLGWRLSGWLGC